MKLKDIPKLLLKKKKIKSKDSLYVSAIKIGYNEARKEDEEREIELDVEKIRDILERYEETEDLQPPFGALQVGSKEWVEAKIKALAKANVIKTKEKR